MKLVSYYDDGLAVFLHAAQDAKKLFGFLRSKNGGGLVKNENIRAAIENLDDFDGLLFGNGHFVYFFEWVDVKTVLFAYFLNLFGGFFKVVFAFFAGTEDYVFCCGKHVDQFEMLMNHADFVIESVLGRSDDCLFSVDENLSVIGKINAGNHVHKRRFTASVFAEDG